MNKQECLDLTYELSVNAGMNQRYHQSYASHYSRIDTGVRIAVGILAFLGAIVSFASQEWATVGIVVAIMSAIAGVVLNVVPVSSWAEVHLDLFRRWSDFRESVDSLAMDIEIADKTTPPYLVSQLQKLQSKQHRICASEPAPKTEDLKKFFMEEEESRHLQCTA